MRTNPVISITNNSSVMKDEEVGQIRIALQHQVTYQFKPFWDSGASLYFTGKKPWPGTWELAFLDDSDQAGALGYHDYDPSGYPIMKVFAKTDKDNGYLPSVTASHEVLEALADPYIFSAAQISDNQFAALEVGDPVEADELGYHVNIGSRSNPVNITVSDFILPHWFIPGSDEKYDYMGHCTQPLEVTEGGYVSIYTDGEGWNQYQKQKGELVQVEADSDDSPRFRVRGKDNFNAVVN